MIFLLEKVIYSMMVKDSGGICWIGTPLKINKFKDRRISTKYRKDRTPTRMRAKRQKIKEREIFY
jgi:hypothetical protein